MEGHWTLCYVLDQVIRMFPVRLGGSHALDYGRGRKCTASDGGNYAFAQGEPEHSRKCHRVMHLAVAIDAESGLSPTVLFLA